MKRAAALWAGMDLDIDGHIFTRQMFWKAAVAWRSLRGITIRLCCRQAGLDTCNISIEIFKTERQLIGIETLGLPSKLVALQLLDDLPELLDFSPGISNLAVIVCHPGSHRPHHLLELIDVGRQCGEIDVHAAETTTPRA